LTCIFFLKNSTNYFLKLFFKGQERGREGRRRKGKESLRNSRLPCGRGWRKEVQAQIVSIIMIGKYISS
jgi:hypothetical protein